MEARPIAEITTNFVLGDFIIHAGLTENIPIGKRKRAAPEHFSGTEATEDQSRLRTWLPVVIRLEFFFATFLIQLWLTIKT